MRVWIDITAPAHVLVFRPLVEIMRGRGDEVAITARDYAQTLELLELHGLEADEVIGRHGGRSRLQKARQMTVRLGALRRWAKGRGIDVALAHGSHELTLPAGSASPPRPPSTTSSPPSSISSAAARRPGSSCRTRSRPSGCDRTASGR